jgi:hypothetical protein
MYELRKLGEGRLISESNLAPNRVIGENSRKLKIKA